MVGSLDQARLPLGIAQREAFRANREDFASGALFSIQLLAMRLQTVPVPLPQLTTVMYLSLWPDEAALARFREQSLRRWHRAPHYSSLTLRPVQSFGSWAGGDPLDGHRSEPSSALLTRQSCR